jgi:hypothetical protein
MLTAEIITAAVLALGLFAAAMMLSSVLLGAATLLVCAAAPSLIARRHDRRAGRR